MAAANPLLEDRPLPAFDRIRPAHAAPAIDAILADNRARIRALAPARPDEASLLRPLEAMEARLAEAFSPVRHLRAVRNSPEWREAYQECYEKIVDYESELSHNKRLYGLFSDLRKGDSWAGLGPARRTEVEHALRDFRLGGVDLPAAQKKLFAANERELAKRQARFSDRVMDATAAWTLPLPDESRLGGLTPTDRALLRAPDGAGFQASLQPPAVDAVLRRAADRELRREVYAAHQTRASDRGPHAGRFDNTEEIEGILRLSREQARLLGFGTIAEHALATRMAESPDEVLAFLRGLLERARPRAAAELAELRDYARAECGIAELERWDLAFVSERLRGEKFRVRDAELRPYFPADAVIAGMLELAGELFRLDIERREDVAVWHPDVRFYELRGADGELRGRFYLDPYARPDKRGGAWMDSCASRRRAADGARPAAAYLSCNAAPPAAGGPALFSHDDVLTLFHEFGHGLHHMLTRVECPSVGGIDGVEWDAVEWPSQWLENWCWEPAVLARFARHHETGAPLPAELAGRLRDSRRFNAGLALLRQLELALFDFRLHLEYAPERGARTEELLAEVRAEVGGVPAPEFARTAHSFEHIFGGGYAAGYYSYKWAEVLAADTFAAFEEEGLLNQETAARFERCMLSAGGVRPAREMFEAFRGRPPDPDALLRQEGLLAEAA